MSASTSEPGQVSDTDCYGDIQQSSANGARVKALRSAYHKVSKMLSHSSNGSSGT